MKGPLCTNDIPGIDFPVASTEESNRVFPSAQIYHAAHHDTAGFNLDNIRSCNTVQAAERVSSAVQTWASYIDSWDMDFALWVR